MKRIATHLPCAVLLALWAVTAAGQTVTNSTNYVVNAPIPDNDLTGLVDARTFDSSIQSITDLRVTLNISGGFNGDYYAYLTHDTGFAVLLNRAGRTAGSPFGYSDSGFNVTFDDAASNGDIHTYQLTLNPGGGALTGTWAPDGRNVGPGLSLDTTPRTAGLASFGGLNANGAWALFVVDASPVGSGTLAGWGIEVVGIVPEPGTIALFVLGGAALFTIGKVRRR